MRETHLRAQDRFRLRDPLDGTGSECLARASSRQAPLVRAAQDPGTVPVIVPIGSTVVVVLVFVVESQRAEFPKDSAKLLTGQDRAEGPESN